MIFLGLFRVIFVIWCALSTVSNAWNLDKEQPPPKNSLGVRLDFYLANAWPIPLLKKGKQISRTFLWSSHLKFDSEVSKLTDAQLWQMAHDGYWEMFENMKLYDITNKRDSPRAFTVLAVGNEIFLSSSMKGGGNFASAYPRTRVSKSLDLCQITFNTRGGEGTNGHKNSGNCGEVMSAQMYYTTDDNENTPLKTKDARVCTVVLNHADIPQNTDPCSDKVSDSEYPRICRLW